MNRIIPVVITSFIFLLCFLGILFAVKEPQNFEPIFLLTLIATAGSLGGIAFALYGWYSSQQIPKMVEEQINKRMEEFKLRFEKELMKQQEIAQKMNAVYQIKDADQKIELLNYILQLDPKAYNAHVTLAYTYWYEKKNYDLAEECFLKALEANPENVQAACDLVAFYTEQNEWRLALKWLKKAMKIKNVSEYIETDARLEPLRKNCQKQYHEILKKPSSE